MSTHTTTTLPRSLRLLVDAGAPFAAYQAGLSPRQKIVIIATCIDRGVTLNFNFMTQLCTAPDQSVPDIRIADRTIFDTISMVLKTSKLTSREPATIGEMMHGMGLSPLDAQHVRHIRNLERTTGNAAELARAHAVNNLRNLAMLFM